MSKIPVTVDNLLDRKKSVYVLNNSTPNARVSLTLIDKGGRPISGEIPPTWVPIDLCALFPPDAVRDSFDIRRYISKGILKLISPKKAEELLSKEEAKEELTKIRRSKYAKIDDDGNDAMASLRQANKDVINASTKADLTETNFSDDSPEVSDKVRDICVQLEDELIGTNDALTKLKSIAHTMNRGDLKYIISQVNSKRIKTWVQERLEEVASVTP